jgi:hypothetical protein
VQEDPYRATEAVLVEPAATDESASRHRLARWLIVLPAAAFGFFLAFAIGGLAMSVLNRACPADQSFDGFCSAPWYDSAFNVLLCACAAIAAFLVVALPSWAAPSHKQLVSWLAYLCGAGVTVSFAIGPREIHALAAPTCALVAGLVAVWLVRQRQGRIEVASGAPVPRPPHLDRRAP